MRGGGAGRRGRGGGGGGGGGRSARPPPTRDVQVSKKLSWLLRHGAEKEGLQLGPGGYVPLDQVISNRNLAGLKTSLEEIKSLVADNDKQRYTLIHVSSKPEDEGAGAAALLNEDQAVANYLIRANQGHSLKVEDDGLITPLTIDAADLPDMVVHGTRTQAWPLIVASGGLKPMGRNHVHFATGLPREIEKARQKSQTNTPSTSNTFADPSQTRKGDETAAIEDGNASKQDVISGMRSSSSILMFLNLQMALKKGIKFGRSANGVILSEGGLDGIVPLEVFERVEDRRGRVLLDGGRLVDDTAQPAP